MKKKSFKILSCLVGGTMVLGVGPKSFAMDTNSTETVKDLSSISVLSIKALTAGNYVRSLKDMVQIVGFIFYVGPSIKGVASRHFMNFSDVFNTDFAIVNEELDEKFHDDIKGQETAKKEIKGYVNNFLEYIVAKKENSKSESKTPPPITKHGHILYLIGESGTGKSECAKTIAKILVGEENVESSVKSIDASSVDSKHKESFKDQLFSVTDVSQYGDGSRSSKGNNLKSNNLGTFIYGHPKSVVIINEYDKICDKDSDEILRTIIDSGIINTSGGQVLDCDEVLFIITSNESKKCFPSLFPEDAKINEQDEKSDKENTGDKLKETNEKKENDKTEIKNESNENSKQNKKIDKENTEDKSKETNEKKENDKTEIKNESNENSKQDKKIDKENTEDKAKEKSTQDKYGTTIVEHDVSFASRLFVVPFERLNKENMKEIAKKFFEEKCELYKNQSGINLVFDDDFLNQVSEYAENSTLGARIIVDKLEFPLSFAVTEVRDKGCSGSFKIKFLLDKVNPSFTLNRTYNQNDVSEIIKSAEKFLQEENKFDCFSNYVFDEDEEEIIDFRSYLSKREIESLKKCVEVAKKINSEKDFEKQKESIDEMQHLISTAYARNRKEEKVKEKNTPWWSRAISWIGDKAARIVAQGK